MAPDRIDVIATSISGSLGDWQKVERIVPLFRDRGLPEVELYVVDSHRQARERTREAIADGGRVVISAGGSGTFKSVLEGCIDSGVPLAELRLGFLRKGSADLIGKVLDMPDELEAAIRVFADAIEAGATLPCDVLRAESVAGRVAAQHFVGYGGTELFGRIPYFTENRLMKWYKGVLGQLFGDLGPFTTGMILAVAERFVRRPFARGNSWTIHVDGNEITEGRYQALLILNGYLGPELPFSSDPLGSGRFHLFALRDLGMLRLPRQVSSARSGAIMRDPERYGMQAMTAERSLVLTPTTRATFPANVDGSTLRCEQGLRVARVDRIPLIARVAPASGDLTRRPWIEQRPE